MSEGRIRFRFGLRLLLLIVALCATVLAWRHAVIDRQRSEWDLHHGPLNSQLERLEKWSVEGHRNLEESEDASFRQELSKNLSRIDADILGMKKRLNTLVPRP